MSDTPPTPGKGITGHKISGIPTVYLVGGGLALAVVFYIYRSRKAGTASGATAGIPTPGTVTDPGIAASSGFGSGGIGSAGGGMVTSTPVTPPTNAQWASGALNAAVGNGSVDPTTGANAVSAYLNGQTLTPAEAATIAKLTTAYGQPPEGVLPISTTAPVSPIDNTPVRYIRDSAGAISAQTASGNTYHITYPEWVALSGQGASYTQLTDTEFNSATAHKYVVQPGDTPESVATRFYGSAAQAGRLPSTLTPGSTISIPVG